MYMDMILILIWGVFALSLSMNRRFLGIVLGEEKLDDEIEILCIEISVAASSSCSRKMH